MLSRIAKTWEAAWGQGDTKAFEALVAEDYVRHSKTGEQLHLPDILKQIEESHAAFSDFNVEILQGMEKKRPRGAALAQPRPSHRLVYEYACRLHGAMSPSTARPFLNIKTDASLRNG